MEGRKYVVISPCEAEITEKKSRFIALCQSVSCEEEAQALIAAQRKKYYDARHVCFAWVCGEKSEVQRFSDDGEPSGTAGKPILEVINGYGLKNALITVTRYFGGTLLGTGGLVRAYTQASKLSVEEGLKSGAILETARGASAKVCVEYSAMGKFEHLCRTLNIQIDGKDFGADVGYDLLIHEEDISAFEKALADLTGRENGAGIGPVGDFIFKL